MARSFRKYPAVCHYNNKWGRRYANKKFRRKNKVRLIKELEPLLLLREVSDIWGWPSDGKAFFEQDFIFNQRVTTYLSELKSYFNSYLNNKKYNHGRYLYYYRIDNIIEKYNNPEDITIDDIKNIAKKEWKKIISK